MLFYCRFACYPVAPLLPLSKTHNHSYAEKSHVTNMKHVSKGMKQKQGVEGSRAKLQETLPASEPEQTETHLSPNRNLKTSINFSIFHFFINTLSMCYVICVSLPTPHLFFSLGF